MFREILADRIPGDLTAIKAVGASTRKLAMFARRNYGEAWA